MFKNAYILKSQHTPTLEALREAAERAVFVPCSPTQRLSFGFVPARGVANDELVLQIGDAVIMRVHVETRTVPSATLKKEVARRCVLIEQQTGRAPGKKQRAELKERAEIDLLPQAFSKESDLMVWLDRRSGTLVIDTSSAARVDDIATLLVRMCDDWQLSVFTTQMSSRALMTAWLHDGAPDYDEFDFGRDATLNANDESKASVSFVNCLLDSEDVKLHLRDGSKSATRLALVWRNRVSFTLDESFSLRKIELSEDVQSTGDGEFDGSVAIATGELRAVIADLLAAHDGEIEHG